MKVVLFFMLIFSTYSFAQSGHDHAADTKTDHQHGDMHKGDHHGGMHGGGHHPADKNALKQFFEPLPASIIDEKKNEALIKLGKKLYLDPRL